MSRRASKQLPEDWEGEKNFTDFFKDYVKNDAYLREENEHLRTYLTYRALYKIYIHSINTQSGLKSIADKFAQFSDTLEQVNNGLNVLQKVIDEQEKMNESAKFYTKLIITGSIGLLIVAGYLLYKLGNIPDMAFF